MLHVQLSRRWQWCQRAEGLSSASPQPVRSLKWGSVTKRRAPFERHLLSSLCVRRGGVGVKVDRVHLETNSVSKQPPSCFGYRFFFFYHSWSKRRYQLSGLFVNTRGDFLTFSLFPVDVGTFFPAPGGELAISRRGTCSWSGFFLINSQRKCNNATRCAFFCPRHRGIRSSVLWRIPPYIPVTVNS